MSLNVLDEQTELLSKAGAILRRLVIPAKEKVNMLRGLQELNIGAHSLFPGLDGLGRSTAQLIKNIAL